MATILVVDDDEKTRLDLENFLNSKNYSIISAINGKQAINFLKKATKLPDLILLDAVMAELDGYSACKIIRKEISQSVPIVFLIMGDGKSFAAGLSAGGNGFLVKPFDYAKLEETLKKLILPSNGIKKMKF